MKAYYKGYLLSLQDSVDNLNNELKPSDTCLYIRDGHISKSTFIGTSPSGATSYFKLLGCEYLEPNSRNNKAVVIKYEFTVKESEIKSLTEILNFIDYCQNNGPSSKNFTFNNYKELKL